jgi:hypothetical protein
MIPFGAVDVCGESSSISHGHHDLLLDYGNFVQLNDYGFFLRKSWENSSQKQEER